MKKMLVRGMVCAMLLWTANGLLLTGDAQTFTRKEQAIAQLASPIRPLVYEVVSKASLGHAMVIAEPSGLGVAAVILPASLADIGFSTSYGLTNTGMSPWTNVTVTATIQVNALSVSPNTKVLLTACGFIQSSEGVGQNVQRVSATGNYTITSQPFSVFPNKEYKAFCGIKLIPDGSSDVQWVRVQMIGLKINL